MTTRQYIWHFDLFATLSVLNAIAAGAEVHYLSYGLATISGLFSVASAVLASRAMYREGK